MANIDDIAKLAGVSKATVSYVINNKGKVSKETYDKVLSIIEEMNYQPSNIAKSLKTKKTKTIGIIAEDVLTFSTPEIINGIIEYTESCGFNVILSDLRIYQKIRSRYIEIKKHAAQIAESVKNLISSQIDGIIYVGVHNRDIESILGEITVPIIYTYCFSSTSKVPAVNFDDESAAYEAVKHLIEMGHKKIGILCGMQESLHSQERFKGFLRGLYEFGIPFNPMFMKYGDWEYNSGYSVCNELLDLPDRPTAVLAMNDLMAAGFIDAAVEKGLKVPADISIIGFDNREFSFFLSPKLTTVALPLNEMGNKAAEDLISLIEDNSCTLSDKKLECKLIIRKSVLNLNG